MNKFIDIMKKLVLDHLDGPSVESTARYIVSVEPDEEQYFKAIEEWVHGHVVFTPDPCSEWILSPERMLSEILKHGRCVGDGPDIAVLTAALCLSIGLDVQYVAVGFHGRPISYIFTRAKLPKDTWDSNLVAGKPFAEQVTESTAFPVAPWIPVKASS